MAHVRHSKKDALAFVFSVVVVLCVAGIAYYYLDAYVASLMHMLREGDDLMTIGLLVDDTLSLILLGSLVLTSLSLIGIAGVTYHMRRKEEEIIFMKSDFVAAAAHELRSPLTSIRWTLSGLQRDSSLSPTAHATVNQMYERVRSMIDLTNTFLIASSTEHGVMRPDDLKVVNISPVILSAIEHTTVLALVKKIKIDTRFPLGEEHPIIVRADAERLRLVFENLLSNAIKYSPQGSTITVRYEDRGNTRLFSIHDQGIGVPKKFQKTIFTGFQRAANAKKSGIHGSGFGLYMVKKIIDFHGGKVWCESEEGQGTTMSFIIPAGV